MNIIKNKKAIVVSNGCIKNPSYTYKKITADYGFSSDNTIIAAYGGAANCLKMGLVPNIVICDMDSIKNEVREKLDLKSNNIKYMQTPCEKDESDTRLAVEYAVNAGAKKIIIAGATGDRLDHSFANLILLSSPFPEDVDIKILTDNSEVFVVKNSCVIKGQIGKLISIFSLTPYTSFIETSGLKYRLKNEKLLFSPVRGLSNIFTEATGNKIGYPHK